MDEQTGSFLGNLRGNSYPNDTKPCAHERTRIRFRESDGVVSKYEQCLYCGRMLK
jgi:hypothetical protein